MLLRWGGNGGIIFKRVKIDDENIITDYIDEFIRYGSVINGLSGATSCKNFQELYKKLQLPIN